MTFEQTELTKPASAAVNTHELNLLALQDGKPDNGRTSNVQWSDKGSKPGDPIDGRKHATGDGVDKGKRDEEGTTVTGKSPDGIKPVQPGGKADDGKSADVLKPDDGKGLDGRNHATGDGVDKGKRDEEGTTVTGKQPDIKKSVQPGGGVDKTPAERDSTTLVIPNIFKKQ